VIREKGTAVTSFFFIFLVHDPAIIVSFSLFSVAGSWMNQKERKRSRQSFLVFFDSSPTTAILAPRSGSSVMKLWGWRAKKSKFLSASALTHSVNWQANGSFILYVVGLSGHCVCALTRLISFPFPAHGPFHIKEVKDRYLLGHGQGKSERYARGAPDAPGYWRPRSGAQRAFIPWTANNNSWFIRLSFHSHIHYAAQAVRDVACSRNRIWEKGKEGTGW
jgi:hypothetical protein